MWAPRIGPEMIAWAFGDLGKNARTASLTVLVDPPFLFRKAVSPIRNDALARRRARKMADKVDLPRCRRVQLEVPAKAFVGGGSIRLTTHPIKSQPSAEGFN